MDQITYLTGHDSTTGERVSLREQRHRVQRLDVELNFTLALLNCAIRLKKAWIAEVMAWFKTEWIEDPSFRAVSDGILQLVKDHHPCTALEIATVLQKSKKFGRNLEWLKSLFDASTAKAGHIRYYAMRVYDEYRRARLAAHLGEAASDLVEAGDIDDVLDRLANVPRRYKPIDLGRGVENEKAIKQILDEMEGKTMPRIAFCIGTLDHLLGGGLEPNSLTVVGAATSSGKSCLLGQIALETVRKRKKGALFFALEMTAKEVYQRWARYIAGPFHKDRKPMLEALSTVKNMAGPSGKLQLFTGARSMRAIENQAMQYCETTDVGVIVVDYLQIVVPNRRIDNRQEQVADTVRRLKQLATKLRVPVVTASQLNRQHNDKPTLTGLRESGTIEQDADVVILIDPDKSSALNVEAKLAVAKNRNGRVGVVHVLWEKATHRFRDKDAQDGAVQEEMFV